MCDNKKHLMVRYYIVIAFLLLCLTYLGIASCNIVLNKCTDEEVEELDGQQIEQTIQYTINTVRTRAHKDHIEQTTL